MRESGLLLIAALCGQPSSFAASSAPIGAPNGMVVSAQHEATRVGVEVLRKGGNAVDAAVAVGYALAVVYPAAGNLGGGGFMTLRMADGRQSFIDFREVAPAKATREMYLGPDSQPLPGKPSLLGHSAAAVPGTVRGLELARERYGSQPRQALIAPAIRLAERGFRLEAGDLALLNAHVEALSKDAPVAAVFLNRGQPWQVGQQLVQRDLARTLRALSAQGVAGFYGGAVAAALVKASQAGGGQITREDLARYRARELAPLHCQYRGYALLTAPPPSSGGVVLCQMLRVLEAYPLRDWGYRSARGLHVQIEAMRHAFADRNLLGDPGFVDSPVARLLSEERAAQVRAAIVEERAGDSRRMGPTPAQPEGGSNTTHYSVVDRHGNAVSVTYTLNDWFGAKVMAAGTGVLMNNEMDDFTTQPGRPNNFGLVQGELNTIAPGKRPLSSMTPTLLLDKEGRLAGVLGTPGGPRIITAVLQALLNLIDYEMTLQEAVEAPRFHHQWLPDETGVERFALSPDTQRLLEAKGHRFVAAPPPTHLAAILVGAPSLGGKPQAGLKYWGANDPRRGTGLAAGY